MNGYEPQLVLSGYRIMTLVKPNVVRETNTYCAVCDPEAQYNTAFILPLTLGSLAFVLATTNIHT